MANSDDAFEDSKVKESDDSCHACGGSGKLLCCDTCTAVYHLKCLLPPLKVVPRGKWSCPQCMRPPNTGNDEGSTAEPSTKKFVKHYLVKWKSMSYLHCSWVSLEEFEKVFKAYPRLKTRINNFHRQMDSMNISEDDWVPIRPKWKELAYDECSWEVENDICAFRAQIERFNSIKAKGQVNTSRKRKGSSIDAKEAKRRRKDFQQYDQTPKFLAGGTLHPYQLEGLNFLRFAWLKGTHVILADEMGLGKTIQSISFLASLAEENVSLPHLVVAPLSTLRNWEREFATWAPHMNVNNVDELLMLMHFLDAGKVANFEYVDEEEAAAARAEEARKQAEADRQFAEAGAAERAHYWDELLKDKYDEQRLETFTELGKGKRSRKQIVSAEEDDLAGLADVSSDDEEEDQEVDWMETEASVTGRGLTDTSGKKSQTSRKRAREAVEPPPLMEGEGKSFRVLGFTQNQRATFVQILMRFGLGDFDWSEFIPRMKQKSPEEIKEYGTLFLTHIAEDVTESPTFSDGVPKEGLRIQDVLVRLAILHLIKDKVKLLAENPGVPLFANDIYGKFPALKNSRFWKDEHDSKLLQAILKHGYGRWQAVVEDQEVGFQQVIRKELQLPSINASTTGSHASMYAGVTPATENKYFHAHGDGHSNIVEGQVRTSVAADYTGGENPASLNEKKTQLHQDGLISAESRDVQKRMVEFIRKRVLLLEKALNAEYHKESISCMETEDHLNVEDADAQSDDREDDLGLGAEANSDSDHRFDNQKASPKNSGNACDRPVTPMAASDSTPAQVFQTGQTVFHNANSRDLSEPILKGGANCMAMPGKAETSGCLLTSQRNEHWCAGVIVLDD